MAAPCARIAITLDWVGPFEDRPWLEEPRQPSAEAVTQLFYGLRLLYLDALEFDPRHPRWRHVHRSPLRLAWFRTYPQWRRLLRRYPVDTGTRRFEPPPGKWPSYVPTPAVPPEVELRVESLSMASPLEIVLAIPHEALVSAGAFGLLRFVSALERAWHTKKRIRLEGIELDRKIAEEELARDISQRRYDDFKQSGFALREGTVHLPDDWEWPKDRR